jgi:hypothetical protein
MDSFADDMALWIIAIALAVMGILLLAGGVLFVYFRSTSPKSPHTQSLKTVVKNKRPIRLGDLLLVASAIVGVYAALFAPWPFYTMEARLQLAIYDAVEQAGALGYLWAYMHSFGLLYWIPVILFSFLLLILTLLSGRLRARLLPWLWLLLAILGCLFPFLFFLLDYVADDGYLVKDIFLVWGLPLSFVTYACIGLTAVFLISTGSAQRGTQRVKCPYCAELIAPEAKICRFCGRSIESDG